MKRHWIFQGNPDVFPVDEYIAEQDDIVWSVRQKHLADKMTPGDQVFLWKSAGKAKGVAGIIAMATITSEPEMMKDDEISQDLWEDGKNIELRIKLSIGSRCLGAKQIVKREWLKEDPIVSDMLILKQASGTNFLIEPSEARRLAQLVSNTGRAWNHQESIAGLWAYAHTYDSSVSKSAGSPVSSVAVAIGRAVTGVYNKVMNFRALDPRDSRKGLTGGSKVDDDVWNQFYDSAQETLDIEALNKLYLELWGASETIKAERTYTHFGEAPNDDPNELQAFAAKVRRGQPQFRDNLLEAYGGRCVICGHGPDTVLEAVHIVPHAVSGINELDNGLLMRADLHYLFDAGLLRIKPKSKKIVMDKSLKGSTYYYLHGKPLRLREDGTQISTKYLKIRKNS